jgi:hypothetical protein
MICVVGNIYSADSDPRTIFPEPVLANKYGEFHILKIRRAEGAGKFPISYSDFDVIEIDGNAPKKKVTIMTEFEEHDPGINGEITVAAFESIIAIGIPQNIPKGYDIEVRQSEFHFRNKLIVISVKK